MSSGAMETILAATGLVTLLIAIWWATRWV
jgi:hypothetical protein